MPSENLKKLRDVTLAHYRDELAKATREHDYAAYRIVYWTRAIEAAEQLCLEMNVVVEAPTPAPPGPLPDRP